MVREVAVEKRIKIGRFEREMVGLALVASIIIGVSVVLAVYFFKYINFNTRVIEAKDDAIKSYETAINSIKQLETGVLALAEDEALNSVEKGTVNDKCYEEVDGNKVKKDFEALYQSESDSVKKAEIMRANNECSALRVIPDALPAVKNVEATMAALNQIYRISQWEPKAITPSSSSTGGRSSIKGVNSIPISVVLSQRGSAEVVGEADVRRALDGMEKSIRAFDIDTATIKGGGGGERDFEISLTARAYYVSNTSVSEKEETIYATDDAKKNATGAKK